MKIANVKTKVILDYYFGNCLLWLLKPFVSLLNALRRTDHSIEPRGKIVYLKLLGGGSLVIALPSLLGLRRRFPHIPLHLVTTSAVAPFAELLGVFDRIIMIDDKSFFALILSSLKAFVRCFGADAVVDLEVYSRLTTVFSLLTCARNRIGFFLDDFSWRKNFNTHLVYFNRHGPVFHFYEQIVRWIGATSAPMADCQRHVMDRLPAPRARENVIHRIAVGHACSNLSYERILKPRQWLAFFKERVSPDREIELMFLGVASDRAAADSIIQTLVPHFPCARFLNLCGELKLKESIAELRTADDCFGIDSSIMHFARLLGIKSVSFWGPTSPANLLKPIPGLEEEIFYENIPCSPCIHVAEIPPCNGNNLCMDKIFDKSISLEDKSSLFSTWSKNNPKDSSAGGGR